MEVEDGLAGAGADVEDGAVAVFDVALAGDVGGGEVAAAYQFGVFGLGFFESGEVFFGDDQDVGRGLRVDVFEGEDVFVFVNLFGWNFTAEDAAEEAVGVGHRWNSVGNDSTDPERLSATVCGATSRR